MDFAANYLSGHLILRQENLGLETLSIDKILNNLRLINIQKFYIYNKKDK
jgi:hypothetical protein